jgi:anaerobic magnesium-protoporphyrin IX monomethyl ester cyclase
MKVLLIQPPGEMKISIGCKRNYSEARSPLPPLGLLYLAGHLKKNHDVKVIDMALGQCCLSELISFRPDIVGISAVIGLWPTVVDIVNLVKGVNSSIHTVVGGPNATQYPEETLSHKNIDFVITGLGQFPMMELCNQLEKGESGEGIENCYIQGMQYGTYITKYPHKLDEFELPDREATPFNQYQVGFCPENPTTTMVTSMGCPFKCAFCNSHNHYLEIRSAKRVVDEIEAIQKMGIKSILFEDELFTLISQRVKLICESLIERKIKVHWSVKSRVDFVQPWMLELMKEAGCFNVHFGIESGNESTLKRMKKGYNVDQIRYAVQIIKHAGLTCTSNFMLAYPGESEEDILNTISFAKSLNLDIAQFSITLDLPKTELFDEAIASGRRHGDPWSEFTRHPERTDLVEIFSSELPQEKLFEYLDEAHRETRTLYDRIEDGSGRLFYHGNV